MAASFVSQPLTGLPAGSLGALPRQNVNL